MLSKRDWPPWMRLLVVYMAVVLTASLIVQVIAVTLLGGMVQA